jgi:pyruvate formate lyase activating enzyme
LRRREEAYDCVQRRRELATLKISGETSKLHEAQWWDAEPNGKVHCYLRPRHCHIGEGQAGFCFIRANEGRKLYSLGYAHPAALQIDPIEKKPLNHFLPGTRVFSMGNDGGELSGVSRE